MRFRNPLTGMRQATYLVRRVAPNPTLKRPSAKGENQMEPSCSKYAVTAEWLEGYFNETTKEVVLQTE